MSTHSVWLESAHAGKVKAKAVVADFSKVHDTAQWATLRAEIDGLDVGVLGMLPVVFINTLPLVLTRYSEQRREISFLPGGFRGHH